MDLLARYRWLTVALPVLIIGIVELLADSVLDPALPFPADTAVVVAVVAFVAIALWWVAWQRIDRLAGDLDRRNRQLERRTATARALHQASVAITVLADLDEILRTIATNARTILDADVAVLVLAGQAGRPARLVRSGHERHFRTSAEAPLAGEDPSGAVSRAWSTGDVADTSLPELDELVRPEARVATLAAPLQRGGSTIGSLAVGSTAARAFSVDDVEALASLANQAAIAIENARLHDELRGLAIVAERERIAREMHDGLAQVLGYVNTKSQAVEELLLAGRADVARTHLAELAAAARSIYVDVREAILGLSSPIDPSRGIVAPIEEYATRFADSAKLAVRVDASAGAAQVPLAPEVQAQVFRIVQEALTNVRKHARAGRVSIGIRDDGPDLVITITDDGVGGTPGDAPDAGWPRYGARAMLDRAAAVGAALDWTGRPGEGTTVRLRIPVSGVASGATH
jgi:signal transduction histidine kinase